MSQTKEISISIDVEELEDQVETKREKEDPEGEEDLELRSTIFSLGKDPRVGIKRENPTPEFRFIEILKDGVDNPFLELNWRIPRFDVDSAGVVGFNVWRRKLSTREINASTRDRKRAKLRGFNRGGFDRIARKTIKKGKFSQNKKSISNIKRSLIPKSILNPNLDRFEDTARSRFNSSLNRPTGVRGSSRFVSGFSRQEPVFFRSELSSFSIGRFQKIAYVDYTKFLAREKKKFVFVTEREFIDLSYEDKMIGYGEEFEYYITSITEEAGPGNRSNSIGVRVEDPTPIRPPSELRIIQLNENEVQLRICADSRDNISNVIVFRRPENEITYTRVASIPNVNDCFNLVDSTVEYTRSYSYRIFMENIHGTLSEPGEIDITSTVQRITSATRSNNFKIPIITAIQDQNSDFIKITISSNDPNISYYELERRDLTINERKFSSPSKRETNFGGDGWTNNKLFVDKNRDFFDKNLVRERDLLNRRGTESEIIFIDNAVQIGHIYQYRVRGYDLFRNPSSYALDLIKVTGKKVLRTPINLKSQILRGSPFRVKISWDDDNLSTKFSSEELFKVDTELSQSDVKFIYAVQRRRLGEINYDSFPLTANEFIVDEVSSADVITFQSKKVEDTFEPVSNIETEDETITVSGRKIERPAGLPFYLEENSIYFYRVEARDEFGEISNFTEEFEVSTLPDLSDPLNFRVEVINSFVKPFSARLIWESDPLKALPDHWIIERKFDTDNDTFEVVGRAYLDTEFFDRGLKAGNTYLYRIKSVDVLGRESQFFDERLTL